MKADERAEALKAELARRRVARPRGGQLAATRAELEAALESARSLAATLEEERKATAAAREGEALALEDEREGVFARAASAAVGRAVTGAKALRAAAGARRESNAGDLEVILDRT